MTERSALTGRLRGEPPPEFDEYTLVVLMRGPRAAEFDDNPAGMRLQREHLAYQAALRRAGSLVVNGPFRSQPDPTWRGLCIYRTALDDAMRLARQDPAVQAGRLDVVAMTWLTRKGALRAPSPDDEEV